MLVVVIIGLILGTDLTWTLHVHTIIKLTGAWKSDQLVVMLFDRSVFLYDNTAQ
jgi:hypothetical protein